MKKCTRCGSIRQEEQTYCGTCGSAEFVPFSLESEERGLTFLERLLARLRALGTALLFILLFIGTRYAVSGAFVLGRGIYCKLLGLDIPAEVDAFTLTAVEIAAKLLTVAVVLIIPITLKKKHCTYYGLKRFSPKRLFPSVILGISANVILSVAVSLIPWGERATEGFESAYGGMDSMGFVIYLMSICLLTGIEEELLFRGGVMGRLSEGFGGATSVIISAVLFGLMHMTPIAMCYSAVFGVLLGAMTLKSGSVIPAAVCHVFFNLTAYFLGTVSSPTLLLGIILVSAAAMLFCLWLFFKRDMLEKEKYRSKI